MAQLLRSFIVTGLFLSFIVAAWGYGFSIIYFFKLRDPKQPDTHLLSVALGLGVMAHLTLALGVAVGLNIYIAIGIISVGFLLGFSQIIRLIRSKLFVSLNWQSLIPRKIEIITVILLIILAVNCVYPVVANALTPPIIWDEVSYHLGIPHIYLQQGYISYINFIPYSNWPLETEMLYTLSLLFSSEKLAHLLTWLSMILICAGLFLYGKRYFNTKVGLFAAVIFSTTPLVLALAGTGMIEVPLALFTFLSVITFVDWVKSGQKKALILSAVFSGLAASTKLNAAMIPLILGVLVLIISFYRKDPFRLVISRFVEFGFLAFLIVCPWYLKSWVQTGNPFFSFFMGIFPTRNWDTQGAANLLGFIASPNVPKTVPNFFRVFWMISANPGVMGAPAYSLGLLYLLLLPISLVFIILGIRFSRDHRITAGWLFVLSVVLYTNWFFQTHQSRFMLPSLPILSLTAAIGAAWLLQIIETKWKVVLQILIISVILLNSWVANPDSRQKLIDNWAYLSGQIGRESFLEMHISGFDTFIYANNHLPANAFVWLALYEDRGYYLDRHYMWANPVGQRAIRLEQYSDSAQLVAALRQIGINYILYNSLRTDRYSYIPHGTQYSALIRGVLKDHARLLFSSNELELYELTP